MLSSLAAETRDKQERMSWTQTDELLARLIELISVMRQEFLLFNGVKSHRLPPVMNIPRPGDKPSGPVRLSAAEFAALNRGAA